MQTEIIEKELCYKINGCCFKVHNKVGRFCSERQYGDELELVFKQEKINYIRECEIKKIRPESPAGNRVDFMVEDKIPVDLKAKKFVTKEDYDKMLRYLYASNAKVG